TYSQNVVRFPHCAVLFVVHEGLQGSKPRVLRHRQAPLPAPFSQLKRAAGSNAMEEKVSELRFPRAWARLFGLICPTSEPATGGKVTAISLQRPEKSGDAP